MSVSESYRLCRRVARRAAKNFYYAFLVLDRPRRDAMCAVYAFMRRSDDLADDAASPAEALAALRQWREQVTEALRGGDCAQPILPALVDTVRRYQIPERYFGELLDGVEMDQRIQRYETFADLYRYCYHVASVVGLTVLPILGCRDTAAAQGPAEACGIAFQLTNIIRDVRQDAQLNRIYLPREHLRRFGVEEDDILQCRDTPELRELLCFEAAQAREYYARARPLLELLVGGGRAAVAVMMGIYGGILDKIERRGFAVMDGTVRLTAMEKLKIVLQNWWRYR